MISSSPSDLGEGARRHDPSAWTRTLPYRSRAELPFDPGGVPPDALLMFDTTVYVDELHPKGLPLAIGEMIDKNDVLHSAVACAELAITIGHLDPAHPRTRANRSSLERTLATFTVEETAAPSSEAWTEAAVIAGILARIQGYPKDARRDLLLDALIFLTAREAGAFLVSRNVRHMDLLLRFRPDTQVLLYERT